LYKQLVFDIGNLLTESRKRVSEVISNTMILTYWQIGRNIVEYEQKGKERAEYGSNLINRLSKDLTDLYGKGFNRNNLQYMRKLYILFPNCTTLSCNLTWSHYQEILKLDNSLEISFYMHECENSRWSVRELKRQRDSLLFHRLIRNKDKEEILKLANKGIEMQNPEDILHDPYVMEFLGFPDAFNFKESDVENAIMDNMSKFLLELGKGFAFYSKQYRISLGGRHLHVDLVFYNVILKCYVLIDLKIGKITHQDVGQMDMYRRMYDDLMRTEGDNPTIGIVLCSDTDKDIAKYSILNGNEQLFATKYMPILPSEEELRREIEHQKELFLLQQQVEKE
jgi:predicted nuclease of restriction endonuclease-like (RecB) superfamily